MTVERDENIRAAVSADMGEFQSPQSTARDFGEDLRSGLGVIVVAAIASIIVASFTGWLIVRGLQGAVVDAEAARAMARAYLEGM